MVKLRPAATILGLIALLLLASASISVAQQPVVVTVGNITVDACSGRLSVPIFMQNPYPVGGFTFILYCTDPTWLNFSIGADTANWDTAGGRIIDWEAVSGTVQTISPGTIRMTAISDMPGGQNDIHLPPGSGQILTLHPKLSYDLCADTSQLLLLGNLQVSDTSGYELYPDSAVSDFVYVLPGPCVNSPRGDANCSGSVNGIDVVYLVAYFKGIGNSYCCLCTGDTNNNGSVNGIDITYLVAYFKGQVPSLAPCD